MVKNVYKHVQDEGSVFWRLTFAVVMSLLLLVAAKPAYLAAAEPQEYRVKAAFINNFARFVQWPAESLADPGDPFTLYILGEDRFGEAFDSFEGKVIHGRPFAVHRAETWEDIPADCRILYVGVSDKKEVQRLLEKVGQRPILTISDDPSFTEMGGIIGFVTVESRIRFKINLSPAGEAGLVISSNLIKLALSVQGAAR